VPVDSNDQTVISQTSDAAINSPDPSTLLVTGLGYITTLISVLSKLSKLKDAFRIIQDEWNDVLLVIRKELCTELTGQIEPSHSRLEFRRLWISRLTASFPVIVWQKYPLSVGLSQYSSAIGSFDRGRLAVALHYTEFQAIFLTPFSTTRWTPLPILSVLVRWQLQMPKTTYGWHSLSLFHQVVWSHFKGVVGNLSILT